MGASAQDQSSEICSAVAYWLLFELSNGSKRETRRRSRARICRPFCFLKSIFQVFSAFRCTICTRESRSKTLLQVGLFHQFGLPYLVNCFRLRQFNRGLEKLFLFRLRHLKRKRGRDVTRDSNSRKPVCQRVLLLSSGIRAKVVQKYYFGLLLAFCQLIGTCKLDCAA